MFPNLFKLAQCNMGSNFLSSHSLIGLLRMSCWQPKPDSEASPGACLEILTVMRVVLPASMLQVSYHYRALADCGAILSALMAPFALCQLSITCVVGALCSGAQADCSACRGAGGAGAGLPEHCRRPAAPARAGLCTSLYGRPIRHQPSFLMLCTESPPCASDLDHLSSSVSS